MMQQGLRIGSVFGIPLYVRASWFPIVAILAILKGGAWGEAYGWSVPIAAAAGAIGAISLFGSVLLHEIGHSLVAKAQGIPVRSISLFLFGGVAEIDRESRSPSQAFQVAIAGPAVSLFLAVSFTALSHELSATTPLAIIVRDLAQLNLVLCLFNLIPGLPLDGGQVLKAAIWQITGDRLQGMRYAVASGQMIGSLAIGLGVFGALTIPGLGVGLWLALVGWFIIRNAAAYGRVTSMQAMLLELQASQVMTQRFRVVDAELTIREFTDRYILCELADTPLFGKHVPYFAAAHGRYRGQLPLNAWQAIDRNKWETTTIDAIVSPLLETPHVREATPLVEVVRTLEREQLKFIVVLSPADTVAGTIDRADITQALGERLDWSIPDDEIQRIRREARYPAYLRIDTIAAATETDTTETDTTEPNDIADLFAALFKRPPS
jgi:Zn-dependent protease